MVNPATPPTTPPITFGVAACVFPSPDPPPDCEVPDGGLVLLVSIGSPEPPPMILPSEEVVGMFDEEVKDDCEDTEVLNDEAADFVREIVEV